MRNRTLPHPSRRPAYINIVQALRERIQTGAYSVDEFLPPERDLAVELGVSRQTVRQAVELLKAEGIVIPEQGRGTRIVGSAFSEEITPTLFQLAALIIYGISRESSAAICQGCTSVMRQADFHLIVAETMLDAQKRATDEAAYLHSLIDRGIKGIIIYAEPIAQNRILLQEALKRNVHIVQIDRYLTDVPCDYVGVDNEAAAFEMTQHLIQNGHQRIAFFSLAPEPSTCRERRNGYLKALHNAGRTQDNALVGFLDNSKSIKSEVERHLAQWLAMPEPPTAIFAVNDELALLLIQILRTHGVKVPAEMAVVGFDNLRATGFCTPALTTVQQPFMELGATAARLLLDRMTGRAEKTPLRVLLPTQLVIRQSCVFGEEEKVLAKAG